MQEIEIRRCEFEAIEEQVSAHNRGLSSPIDSFAEEHVIHAQHYMLVLDGRTVGFCAVHSGQILTQFHLEDRALAFGREFFGRARSLELCTEALVATCDEMFLSHCMDSYRDVRNQAYLFAHYPTGPVPRNEAVAYRRATLADIELVRAHSEDFFDESLAAQLARGEIHTGEIEGKPVAFGIIEPGRLLPDHASIGMYTKPSYRRQGIARTTLTYLIETCREAERTPIAGCWYYNHNSKQSLESAGMVSRTRYLRFSF